MPSVPAAGDHVSDNGAERFFGALGEGGVEWDLVDEDTLA
jgi:hypothetical protein